jgi:hypothetical protein
MPSRVVSRRGFLKGCTAAAAASFAAPARGLNVPVICKRASLTRASAQRRTPPNWKTSVGTSTPCSSMPVPCKVIQNWDWTLSYSPHRFCRTFLFWRYRHGPGASHQAPSGAQWLWGWYVLTESRLGSGLLQGVVLRFPSCLRPRRTGIRQPFSALGCWHFKKGLHR